jgi:hypothetical protein
MSGTMVDLKAVDLEVSKTDLRTQRFVDIPPEKLALSPGQVLLKVDKFALTANNITYAVAGEMMNYWNFFPALAM